MSQARQVISAVVIAVVTLVGIAAIGPIAGVVLDTTGGGTAVIEPAPDSPTKVSGLGVEEPAVAATTGNALYLNGSGSYVDDPTNESVFADGSWTVAMVAEPSREGRITPNTTATLYAADNESVHVLVEEGNWTARYDHAGGSAYVEAPADLDGRTPVAASYNTSVGELELYVDGQLADSAPLTATTAPRDPAYSWIGSLDEVRVWDAALPTTAHSAYAADPVEPQPTNATARLMFNDDLATTVYYADGDATLVGDTGLVDGVDGPDLVAGSDYVVDADAETIQTTDSSRVRGAPVLFVGAGGALGGVANDVVAGTASAFELIPVLLLVIIASVVIVTVSRLRTEF